MQEMNYFQALKRALREEMRADSRVVIIGEDIAYHGGPYGITQGLVEEFGAERLIETPITESQFVDAAIGMAMMGKRPICDFMTADNLTLAVDQIIHGASQLPFLFGVKLPMVLRGPVGGGLRFAPSHEKSLEALFMNFPGLKVVYPSTAYDSYGLLKAAIQDDNPVIFLEHKMFYFYSIKSQFPAHEFAIPIGEAEVKREGRDISIITWGLMAMRSLRAAQRLAEEGIEVEVVDLRTLRPLDRGTIVASVAKTNRALIIHEAPKFGGFGAEVSATIMEYAFDELDAPVRRLAAPEIPIPWSPPLQDYYLIDEARIMAEVRKMCGK